MNHGVGDEVVDHLHVFIYRGNEGSLTKEASRVEGGEGGELVPVMLVNLPIEGATVSNSAESGDTQSAAEELLRCKLTK